MTGLAIASLVMTVGGGLMSYQAQRQQAQAQADINEYNARMAEYNKKQLLKQQQDLKRQATEQEMAAMKATGQARTEARRRLAMTKAKQAGSGTLVGTGTNLEFLIDQSTQQNLAIADNMRKRFSMVESLRHKADAVGFQAYGQGQEAKLSRYKAETARSAGFWKSGATLLQTGAAGAGMGYTYKKAGVF